MARQGKVPRTTDKTRPDTLGKLFDQQQVTKNGFRPPWSSSDASAGTQAANEQPLAVRSSSPVAKPEGGNGSKASGGDPWKRRVLTYGTLAASTAATALPLATLFATQFASNSRSLFDSFMRGDPNTVAAVAAAMCTSFLGALTWNHVTRSEAEERGRQELVKLVRQQARAIDDFRRMLSHYTQSADGRYAFLCDRLTKLGAVELRPDEDLVWSDFVGDYISINPTFGREIKLTRHHDGSWQLEPTERLRSIMLQRFAQGSRVTSYTIVLYIPRVERPFEHYSTLPARKLVFMCDRIKAFAEAEGIGIDLSKLRILVVRAFPPPNSIFKAQRSTTHGLEDIILTYARGESALPFQSEFNERFLYEFRDAAASDLLRADVERACRSGVTMTLDELRKLCEGTIPPTPDTRMPPSALYSDEVDDDVVADDHFVFHRRR